MVWVSIRSGTIQSPSSGRVLRGEGRVGLAMSDVEHSESADLRYRARRTEAESQAAGLDRRDVLVANLRFGLAIAILALAWPTLVSGAIRPAWILLPIALFVALVIWHGQIDREMTRARRRVAFYDRGLARISGESFEPLDTGDRFADAEHPYSSDLDLFGSESLYAYLCTPRTESGRVTLATWLSGPADRDEILARQGAVDDLADRLDFREEVDVLGAEVEAETTAEDLDAWGRVPIVLGGHAVPVLLGLLGVANTCALSGWLFFGLDRLWLLVVFALSGLVALALRRRVRSVLEVAGRPAHELRFVSDLLRRFEGEVFISEKLLGLQRSGVGGGVEAVGVSPSEAIAELARLTEWNDSRRNDMFAPVSALLLLGSQLAFAIERWRRRHGDSVGGWLREVGEIEALSAFATHRFENPGYAVPEISDGPPTLETIGLAHPLLPADRRIENDVRLEGELQLLLVSGSNMSGKSTLLRCVGTAAVLALAGAPVCAERCTISPVSIGASLHVQDSLAAGISRFYAELRRLARVRELGDAGPTLFLLDEILHGTNSHDRKIGATGVISMLLESGAIGLVTTHDLALTRVAEELVPRALNVHFEDHLEDGVMAFDYRLRPGPVERGNALALMKSLGLHDDGGPKTG